MMSAGWRLPPWRQWPWRRIGWGAAAVAGAAGVLLVALVAWYAWQLPPLDKVLDYKPRQHLQVFTSDGVEIAQFGSERRLYVPLAQVPRQLQDAVLAVEDTGFREHGGISLRGVLRALWANATGGMPQGASTITQQVARTFFLSTRRTPERKIKEALLALEMERRLSKDQILELYLNQIYLGQRSYGFGAAAQTYFGKSLAELDLAETALLAGLPQNPNRANPVANLERAQRRQRVVLGRMLDVGLIDAATRDRAATQVLRIRPPGSVEVQAQHVAEMARLAVYERLGEKTYTEGIRVVTALRAADQQAAHAALRRGVLAHEARQPWRGPEDQVALPAGEGEAVDDAVAQALKEHVDDEDLRLAVVLSATPQQLRAQLANGDVLAVDAAGLRRAAPGLRPGAPQALALRRGAVIRVLQQPDQRWAIAQWPQADGAYVALDPTNGRVRALVGGFDFGRRPFNNATQAWRQPGSAFKPFVYSAAIEAGVAPDTLVDDLPWPAGENGGWSPQNSDGQFDGPITVREAMARSKNLASIRLLQHTGIAATRSWVARFGFDASRQPANLTLALGAGSTTPLQLASAYAVLANGGLRVAPVVVERISDAQGRVLFEAPPPAPQRAVPARNVFVVNSLLAEVTRSGTAARVQATLRRGDLYGKTGTTNDAVDAWFAGFQPGMVAVAWMGHAQPRSLGQGESGGGLALPIWISAMAPVLRTLPLADPPAPPGLVLVDGSWRYEEWAEEPPVTHIGDAEPLPEPGEPPR